jgi:methionyl aminopeptidase
MNKPLDKDKMRNASQLAAHILDEVEKIIKPGVSTLEINDLCHKIIIENKAWPGALNYHGFPKSVCTSINDVICHGIPKSTDILKNGDFINVDIALKLDEHYGDTSRCFKVGKLLDNHNDLMMTTYEAMWKGISICKGGVLVNEIGKVIESFIKPKKYSIVRDFCGHGIGSEMHTDIDIPYYYDKDNKDILITGKCYTIEPMINAGSYKVKIDKDKWTARTIDGSRSAQWEHTIYINNDGCEVMSFNSFDEKKKKNRIIYC